MLLIFPDNLFLLNLFKNSVLRFMTGLTLNIDKEVFVLFVLRLNVPVKKFSVMSGRSHSFLGN